MITTLVYFSSFFSSLGDQIWQGHINLNCEDQNKCVYGGRTHQKLPQLPKPCFFPARRLWFEIPNEQVKSQFETNLVQRRIGKCHRGANTCNSSNAEYGCFCNHCTELIYIEVFWLSPWCYWMLLTYILQNNIRKVSICLFPAKLDDRRVMMHWDCFLMFLKKKNYNYPFQVGNPFA